ncbi:hypothetical protein [Thermococcus peptonophilus]|uniref:Uncharacterized protein n=1 Tax=Thermococcus peptonophilus TaxID=53952 RepID=A0A142CT69_9EURY|nr:hypothetical protein [Thermococcus peptonophilus]AMQ17971.1 hypothetical protein A0127_01690 [Thermococcus peptonophilus]
MKLGVPKLDELLGDIEPGSTLLLFTVGDLGVDIFFNFLKANEERAMIFATPQIKRFLFDKRSITKAKFIVLGEEVSPENLFETTDIVRKLAKDSYIGVFFFQPLFLFHPVEVVQRFFAQLTEIALERRFILLAILDKRFLKEREIAGFEASATHVIEISETISGFAIVRGIRVKKFPSGVSGFYRLISGTERLPWVRPLDEGALVYLLVMLTMATAFWYFSLTLKRLERCLKGCKKVLGFHIIGLSLALLSLALWKFNYLSSLPPYIFHVGAITGSVLYIYPAVKSGWLRLEKELTAQITALLLAVPVFFPFISSNLEEITIFIAIFQSLVLMVIRWFYSMNMLTTFEKKNLRTAAWLIVLSGWLRLYQLTHGSACLYYTAFLSLFIPSVFLLYSAIVVYERISRWL